MKVFKTPRILSWIYPKRTWGFFMDKNEVYLTFDDGPHPKITPWILDHLKEQDVKATFFCVGDNILKYPEIFERIKLEGHQVGNHTMSHENSHKTNWAEYKYSVRHCKKLVENNLFRPPYGRLSAWKSNSFSKEYKIIMWSWLSYDYDRSVNIQDILLSAQNEIGGGDILVLHDNKKVKDRMVHLLPSLLQVLKEKNLKFATISA
jgi:peptidoglycan/xylan/chitin deacetylase (PgdA/CDA1 family)